MIVKIRMIDVQFGIFIVCFNFNDGEFCMFEMLEGFQVEEYYWEDDYILFDIKCVVYRVISGDNQINRFFNECKFFMEEVVLFGCFLVVLKKLLIYNFNLLYNFKGNECVVFEEVIELVNKCVNDIYVIIK